MDGDEKVSSAALWAQARSCFFHHEVDVESDTGRRFETGTYLQEQNEERLKAGVELARLAVTMRVNELAYGIAPDAPARPDPLATILGGGAVTGEGGAQSH